MNYERLVELLQCCDALDRLDLGPCNASLHSRIEALMLPSPLSELLKTCWPQTPERAWIAGYQVSTTAQIISPWNFEHCRPAGLLSIGDDARGDRLLIDVDCDPENMVVLDHETFDWNAPIRSFTASLNMTLADFLGRGVEGLPVPQGYHEAREFDAKTDFDG